MPASLRSYQLDLLRSPQPEVVAVGCTQTGKSFVLACWLLGRAWEWGPRYQCWWAAPTYFQAAVGYDEIIRIARESGIVASTRLHKVIRLVNGAQIHFRSWEKDEYLLGPPVGPMVIDQAELLTPRAHSILSTRRSHTLAPICYGANAGFRNSELWRVCKLAELNPTGTMALKTWSWRHYLSTLAGVHAERYEAFIRAEKIRRSREEFERMYEAKFLDVGAGIVNLRPCCTTGGSEIDPVELPYAEPWGDDEEPCVGGLDLGQKVDPTALTVISRKTVRLKAMMTMLGDPYETQAARIVQFLKPYCRVMDESEEEAAAAGRPGKPRKRRSLIVYYDATAVGEPVGEMLRKHAKGTGIVFYPQVFTNHSKHEMVTSFQVATEQTPPLLEMPWIQQAVSEADTLERKALSVGMRYEAADGFHDDIFWSMAMAVWGLTNTVGGVAV